LIEGDRRGPPIAGQQPTIVPELPATKPAASVLSILKSAKAQYDQSDGVKADEAAPTAIVGDGEAKNEADIKPSRSMSYRSLKDDDSGADPSLLRASSISSSFTWRENTGSSFIAGSKGMAPIFVVPEEAQIVDEDYSSDESSPTSGTGARARTRGGRGASFKSWMEPSKDENESKTTRRRHVHAPGKASNVEWGDVDDVSAATEGVISSTSTNFNANISAASSGTVSIQAQAAGKEKWLDGDSDSEPQRDESDDEDDDDENADDDIY